MSKRVLPLLLVLLLVSCGRISIYNYKAHNLEHVASDKIAILHVTRHNYVKEIDGQGKYSPNGSSDLFPYTGARIEILPGKHTLSILYSDTVMHTTGKSNLQIDVEAGKEYFVHDELVVNKMPNGQYVQLIKFRIAECGSSEAEKYNKDESKDNSWLDPFVPACGPKS